MSTQHVFDLTVSDVDRGVYETRTLDVARHPSESLEYLVTRVLAFALELEEGLVFSRGLCVPDEPALWSRDLTGALRAWIEVGVPAAERLHKATKASPRVVVYAYKPGSLRALDGARVHAPERVTVVELDRALISSIAERLARRTRLAVSVTEGELYVDVEGASLSAPVRRGSLAPG
ncbi:MAG: YaeQ family protein [Myxococcota bacterium]